MMARKPIDVQCSFCGKKRDQVRKLVAGPGVFICDECVELCSAVLKDEDAAPPAGQVAERLVKKTQGRRPGGWFRRLFHAQVLQPAK